MDRERRLLCKAGLALAAGGAVVGCGTGAASNADMAECTINAIGVGDVSDVALNGVVEHMTPDANVFICQDAEGFYAIDVRCTHLQCDVAPKNKADVRQGFMCPCHGSTFDANGGNPTAPAPKPLTHYLLCAQPSGALVVDTTVVVDAAVRLKV